MLPVGHCTLLVTTSMPPASSDLFFAVSTVSDTVGWSGEGRSETVTTMSPCEVLDEALDCTV